VSRRRFTSKRRYGKVVNILNDLYEKLAKIISSVCMNSCSAIGRIYSFGYWVYVKIDIRARTQQLFKKKGK
jgi:hypothetical protein